MSPQTTDIAHMHAIGGNNTSRSALQKLCRMAEAAASALIKG